jgi:hypothetical protein
MAKRNGMRHWVFGDGDLPPAGMKDPKGHEALMVTNLGAKDAHLTIDVLFEDKPPVKGITAVVGSERVRCFRLDGPIGDQEYRIPFGQYALVVRSDVPVVAVFGRVDVRQSDLSYYSVQGYSF